MKSSKNICRGYWKIILLVFLSAGDSVSTFAQTKTRIQEASKTGGARLIDLEIPPFEKTKEGQEYLKKYEILNVTDEWGYPEISIPGWDARPENQKKAKEKLKLKQETLKSPKTSAWIDRLKGLILSDALAYDAIGVLNGFINCRQNQVQTGGFFRIYFRDIAINSNLNYDDPVLGPNRVQAVCDVFQEIAALINLDQTTTIPEIIFESGLPAGAPLDALAAASAYQGYSTSSTDNGTLHQHIISGIDPNPGFFDAIVYTNFPIISNPPSVYDFAWSTDPAPPAGIDVYHFQSVMRHELFHAMGFKSKLPGNVVGSGTEVSHNTFNKFMYEKAVSGVATNPFFNLTQPLTPILMVPNGLYPSWMTSNKTVYQGKNNSIGAMPDNIVPIYSPGTYRNGSSMSHLDDQRASNIIPGSVANICSLYPLSTTYTMNPFACPSNPTNIHADEKKIFCHLGYQVDNVPGCEVATPTAFDDKIILTNLTSTTINECVPMLTNDLSGTNSNSGLVVHDALNESMPAGMSVQYYNDSNCTNTIGSASGAKSVKLLGTNTNNSAIKIRYRIRNENTSPKRISTPASILVSSCSSDPNEFVCNGTFELGSTDNSSLVGELNQAFYNDKIPFWSSNGTCDLTFKNRPGHPSLKTNLPYIFYSSYSPSNQIRHDMNDSGIYAAFCRTEGAYYNESLVTKLKTNLTTGDFYEISFDVYMDIALNSTPLTQLNVIAGLSVDCINASSTFCGNAGGTGPANAFSVHTQPITVRNAAPINGSNINQSVWTHVSKVFQATQNFNYLVLRTPSASTGNHIYNYYNNVSLRKVNTTPYTISGVVYLDNVTTNGTRNPGEPGLENVTVKLFNSSGTEVSTPATSSSDPMNLGAFTLSVPNPNPATYYAVITPENIFYGITEPPLNSSNLLSGYQHVKVIQFTGAPMNNVNFGVLAYTAPPSSPRPPLDPKPLDISDKVCGDSFDPNQPYTQMTLTKSVIHASAPAYNNGSIKVNVSGGAADYTYFWSGSAITSVQNGPHSSTFDTLSNLPGSATNTYDVYVKDGKGCVTQPLKGIKVYRKLTLNKYIRRYCTPNPDGTFLVAQPVGGHGPFTYSWTFNGQPISNNTGMILSTTNGVAQTYGPGTYVVTITDSVGQTATATMIMPSTPPPAFSGTVTNATGTANNGSITIQVDDNWPITPSSQVLYTYTWSDGASVGPISSMTHTRNNLAPGTYTLTLAMNNSTCQPTTKTFVVHRVSGTGVMGKEIKK